MIAAYKHNNSFVKKVDNIVNLFTWTNSIEQDFENLPEDSIVIDDTIVNEPVGLNDNAYQHHATIGRKYGNIYYAHSLHDYDEDAGGKTTYLKKSTNNGETWSSIGNIMPAMSDVEDQGVTPAQWSYPSMFIDVPSGFYLLICCVSSLSYTPVGTAVRKINSNDTFGNVLWINNGVSASDRTVPTPISGYPSYDFADEDLIEEVRFFINKPENKPKILFGMDDVFDTQSTFDNGSGENLREPTTIKPYNYDEWLKVWRTVGLNYNVVQNGEDEDTQTLSELPNATLTTAKRFYNYSPEIIISVGHSKKSNREELGLCIHRKNNTTGVYDVADDDAYSVTSITQTTPVYSGEDKFGGEQLPFINRVGKNKLDIGFSISKETMYYKQVDVSKLL